MYESTSGRPGRNEVDALVDVLAAANRYDLALGVIPVAFAGALVAAHALGVSVLHALSVAAVIGLAVIVDSCYLNPPVDQGSRERH
ncbi:hypothetical protein [Natronococcus wangiae]|uniref:hypothetical protein n=1 Tax=Natronococcus wangiae TaxID=3068275 RepID=UPI00273D6B22|nr:hypothetical protein [Natronococcus sp. AD5]